MTEEARLCLSRKQLTLSERIENMFSFLYAAEDDNTCHFNKDFLDEVKAAALKGAALSERAEQEQFTVGAYTLSPGMQSGKVWIEHESGEGGDFTIANVEKVIAGFYKENF